MANLLLEVVATALATKRMTRLIVDDTVLDEVRDAIWAKYPPETSKLGYLISCHACSSTWAAALVTSRLIPPFMRNVLALSESALLLQAVEERLTD